MNPSGFELVEWLEEGSVVVRFLAGIWRHDDYHSHPVYRGLIEQLAHNCLYANNSLQLVHCAYECPSIMDSVKVDYSVRDTIFVKPEVGFDWYATGYCINHFDERWGLLMTTNEPEEEKIDLLIKGIKSSSVAKGSIWYLNLLSSLSAVFTQLREFCQLHRLEIQDFDHDDNVILQQLIAPGSGLKRLWISVNELPYASTLIPTLFQPSSVENLVLLTDDTILGTELLPHGNTNLKELSISGNLLHLLAALIVNITSLTYLLIDSVLQDSDLPVLTNIVQSHSTLGVLTISKINHCINSTNLLQLIEAADDSEHVVILRLHKSDYDKLPAHIHKLYEDLLKPIADEV